MTTPYVRVTGTGDASLSSTTHGIQVGATSGQNLLLDNNEVLSRNNGASSTLHLQADGGTVTVGAGTAANLVVSSNIQGTTFQDYSNTGYFLNPNSTGTSLNVAGAISSGAITASGTGTFEGGGNTLLLKKGTGTPAIAFAGTASDPQTTALIEGISGGGLKIYTSSGTISSPSWSPKLTLAANGNATFSGSITSGAITTSGNIQQNYGYELRGKDSGGTVRTLLRTNSNKLQIGWSYAGDVEFMGGGSYTKRMAISGSTGDVSIVNNLSVTGNIVGAGINSTASYTELGSTSSSSLVFKRNNASYIQADASGGYFIFVTNGRSTSYGNRALALTTDNHANFGGNVNAVGHISGASGYVSGKFAVKSTGVHASYDFYNNGTSYFNGDTEVNAELKVSSSSAYTTHLNYQDNGQNFISQATSGGLTQFRNSNGTLMEINSSGNVSIANDLTVSGNFSVLGTTTTLNTATLQVEDKNIVLNYGTGDTSGSADGAGITIQDAVNGSTDAAMTWNASSDFFNFSHKINAQGDVQAYNFYGQDYHVLNSAGSGWHEWATRANDKVTLNVSTITSGAITADGGGDQSVIKSSSDAPLIVESTDAYSGIKFKDTGGNSSMFYHGGSDHLYLHSAKFSVAGSTIASGYEFQVNGDAKFTGGIAVNNNSTITGSGSSSNALNVYRGSDSASAFRVLNTGEVLVSSNYFYVDASQGAYFNGNLRARGGISNDGSNYNGEVRILETTQIDGDVRANTFYDRDNTGYYVNPSSDSHVNEIWIDDYLAHNGDGDTYLVFDNNRIRLFAGGAVKLDTNRGTTVYENSGTKSSGDFDNFTDGGNYVISNHANISNSPPNSYAYGLLRVTQLNGTSIVSQEYLPHSSGEGTFIRFYWSPHGWTSWRESVTFSSDGTGTGLDADLLDGHDSGSFLRSNVTDNYTSGTLSFNSGTGLKMLSGSSFNTSDGDVYASMRVIRNAGTSNTDGMYIGYANSGGNSAPTRLFGAGATSNGLYVYSNYSQIYGSARSPIFYDSDDTSKYTNPAGNSILSTASIGHTSAPSSGYSLRVGSIQSANGSIDYLNQVHFNDNLRFYDEGNNNYLNFKYGASGAGGIKFRNGNNAVQGYVYSDNANIGFLSADGSWSLQTNNSVVYAYHQLRSPIFYDMDDTGYYTDPDGLNQLHRTNTNWLGVGTSANSSGSYRLTMGGNIDMNDYEVNHLSRLHFNASYNIYGVDTTILDLKSGNGTNNYLRFKNSGGTVAGGVYGSGTSFGLLDADSNWAIKHDRDNRTGFFINNVEKGFLTNAQLTHVSSVRAPIFYDSNNSGYYAHLDGSSNLNNLSANTTTLGKIKFKGEGTNSNQTNDRYAIYQEAGAWSNPYPDLIIGYHTGIKMGGYHGYGGTRFYNDNPTNGTEIFSVGNGDNHVRVLNNFYTPITYDTNNTANYFDANAISAVNQINLNRLMITSGDIRSNASSSWTGNPGAQGKIQYHSNRWYIVGDSSSNRIVQFRRDGSDKSYIDNDGRLQGAPDFRAPIYYDSNDTGYYADLASTSRLHSIWCRGSATNSAPRWDTSFHVAQSQHFYGHTASQDLYLGESGNHTRVRGTMVVGTNSGATGTLYISGIATATSDFRAPFFYDSDNTAYYANPASTSRFNVIHSNDYKTEAGDGRGIGFWNGAGGSSYSIYMSSAGNSTYGGRVQNEGTSDYNMYFRMNGGTNRGFVFRNNTNNVAGIDAAGHGRFEGSARAPVFYDINNTGYYVHPDSSSRLSLVICDKFRASGSGSNMDFEDNNGGVDMRKDPSGNLVVVGNVTAYGSTSDIRLKENIEPIPDALEKVKKLDGVTFDYKKDGTRSTGLIAQQLQEVLPEVVYEATDIGEEESHLAVRYGNVVGLLVEAMKEQSAQIDALRAEIESLKEN